MFLLCIAILFATVCARTPLMREPANNHLRDEHIILTSVTVGGAAILLIAVAVQLGAKRRLTMSNLLAASVFLAVVLVGIGAWMLTYVTMRRELQDTVDNLILATGLEVSTRVQGMLEVGTTMAKLYEYIHVSNLSSLNASWPTPVRFVNMARKGFLHRGAAVTMLYYGNVHGYLFGVSPRERDPDDPPWGAYAYPPSAPAGTHGLRCPPADARGAACDGPQVCNGTGAQACAATCKLPPSPAHCDAARDPVTPLLLWYFAPWDLPTAPDQVVAIMEDYDCRERPWFREGVRREGLHWTEPYAWSDNSAIGFSSTLRVHNAETGAVEGVIAVDYKTDTVQKVLSSHPPTENSAIFLVALDGTLYSSSLPPAEFQEAPKFDDDGEPLAPTVPNVLRHPNTRIQSLFERIHENINSLDAAAETRHLFKLGTDSSVLVSPLRLDGLTLLVVIEVPLSDVFASSDSVSTVTLVIVLVVSVTTGALVIGILAYFFSKLRELERALGRVAVLKVDEVCVRASCIDEVRSMQTSLQVVVDNLRDYKRYLPRVALPRERENSGSAATSGMAPPGVGVEDPHAGIVFTDIVGSTALWEECTDMSAAVSVHNKILRDCMCRHEGYEVKTIGDAFMVAFETFQNAVAFSLSVLDDLSREWPEHLLIATRGLSLRVGANYGPVTMDFNLLTERMDYYGPAVNRAARLEAAAFPGSVMVLKAVLENVHIDASVLGGVKKLDVAARTLKGIRGEFDLVALIPNDRTGSPSCGFLGRALSDSSSLANPLSSHECGSAKGHAHDGRSDAASLQSSVSFVVLGKDGVAQENSSGSLSMYLRAAGKHSVGRHSLPVNEHAHTLPPTEIGPTKCSVAQLDLRVVALAEGWCAHAVQLFHGILAWLRRTQGSVLSVAGTQVLATFGLGKRTGGSHVLQCLSFAALLQDARANTPEMDVVCGLGTGQVCGCHVGDWEERFVPYFGPGIDAARMLCTLARRLMADALFASSASSSTRVMTSRLLEALRPVARIDLGAEGTVVAYQVSGSRVNLYGQAYDEQKEDVWEWSPAYAELFYAGDYKMIREKAVLLNDVVLCRACDLAIKEMIEREKERVG
eukprot:Rhum_TRINITY_DN14778_c2_g1::Rhum_TRINITY_DN14778_c2_g1_i1::g.115849::m.115849